MSEGLKIIGRGEGFCDVDGVSETLNAGFSGMEYLNPNGEVGAGITWHIDALEAGTYSATIRFANGAATSRQGSILVNDRNSSAVTFQTTGAWTNWQTIETTIVLDQGSNKIELISTSAEGLANIDYFHVVGELAAGGCVFEQNSLTFSSEGDGNYRIQGPYGLSNLARNVPAGTPRGRVENFVWSQSGIFPNTSRGVWVYIPQQYNRSEPAPLMLLHDGRAYINDFGLPNVLDNMIHNKQLPLMVAVFVDNPDNYGAQRSAEYDCLSDRNARFMVEEILPEVERRYQIQFSKDPWLRAIGGHSSGGSAAFTAGWQRPDQFRRILTHSGSFTDLCRAGADAYTYPGLIRSTPVKPLRVFLLTGTNDNGAGTGGNNNWVTANQRMSEALGERGYHRRFVFAEGGSHNRNSGASILPETLLWLWRPGQ